MNEFECINKYIRPLLSSGFSSEADDAAKIDLSNGSLIVTHDIISEGVHFLRSTDANLIAKKAIRVNLSDLASMGASPYAYLLGLSLPKGLNEEWWNNFSNGLREENEYHDIKLVGGDTTSNRGNYITVGITAMGLPGTNTMVRSGAKKGDLLYVSGTIGDSALGLLSYNNIISDKYLYLRSRYVMPNPRVQLGRLISEIATSCIDISDGLLQDVEHICKLSQVGAEIYVDKIPLSAESQSVLLSDSKYMKYILTGGDDYELAFTIPPESRSKLKHIADELDVQISEIGRMVEEERVHVYDDNNKRIDIDTKGYIHDLD